MFNEASFVNIVIEALVATTGIRSARVSILHVNTNNAKRMIHQGESTLELELEIGAGTSK